MAVTGGERGEKCVEEGLSGHVMRTAGVFPVDKRIIQEE